MNMRLLVFLFVMVAAAACSKTAEGTAGPLPASQGISADMTMNPKEGDRCPVCAMTTHDKKMPAAIALMDGRTFYFCGPGCMIRSWLDPKTHLGVEKSALKTAVATEFLTGSHVDAQAAFWVMGSDVVGPMGPMPVALKDQASVDAFKKRHGGTRIFKLGEMTQKEWQAMKKTSK